jgi:hypothetical protein
MTKKKIIEILITALISAGIAFLTNLLSAYTNTTQIHASPEIAGGLGVIISTVRRFFC